MKTKTALMLSLSCILNTLLLSSVPARADEENYAQETESFAHAFNEGSPNIFSAQVVGQDHFDLFFAHNFYSTSFPRGSNPTFWLKYSPLEHLQIDALSSMRSPLELEFGLAYQVLEESAGDSFNLTPRLSFNTRGNFAGAELSASKFIWNEIWQVGMDARVLSSGQAENINRPVAAIGLNTIVRVWKDWHLFGDLVVPLDSELIQRQLLWSAGIKKRIPDSPHILTFYAGNSQEQSLSGRTLSAKGDLSDLFRVGFIFSIDIENVSTMADRLF